MRSQKKNCGLASFYCAFEYGMLQLPRCARFLNLLPVENMAQYGNGDMIKLGHTFTSTKDHNRNDNEMT